jgi:exosome complex component RRP4
MGLKIENKSVVVPGDILAEGMDYLPGEGAFRDGDNVISSRIGLSRVDGRAIRIIPLAGTYLPKAGDRIICKVIDVTYSAWRVNTNTAYSAMLSLSEATTSYIERGTDLSKIYGIGDFLLAKITNVTGQNLIDITLKGPGLHKLSAGRIIEVDPVKVPRIIGKQGSMVTLIKNATDCQITVGQNGLIWLRGKDPAKEITAVDAIRKIEKEAHKQGLTDTMQTFLSEKTGVAVEVVPEGGKNE